MTEGSKNDCAYRISTFVHGKCIISLLQKRFFSLLTIKQNPQWDRTSTKQIVNTREMNPVWNKWQPQLLVMCSHVGLNIQKNITCKRQQGWYFIHLITNLTIYVKFDTSLLKINLKFVLGNLSSILDVLDSFYNFMEELSKEGMCCRQKNDNSNLIYPLNS